MFVSMIGSRSKSRRGGSGRGGDISQKLAYSTHVCGSNGHKTKQAVFYFGVKLMKKARLIVGDYIDILKDGEMGLVKRTNGEYGRKITQSSNCKTTARVSVKADGFPLVNHIVDLDNIVINDEGILFDWPKGEKQE